MADIKISALTDGGEALATDDVLVVRAGANRRVRPPVPFGPYATLAALIAAKPPTTALTGRLGYYGSAAPYSFARCDGASWVDGAGNSGGGVATNAEIAAWAGNLDSLITGTITRDTNGAATAAAVVWPDGATGAYAVTTVSTAFPGAVDAYTVTHVLGGVTKTATQSAVTRDANGAVTARPAIGVV